MANILANHLTIKGNTGAVHKLADEIYQWLLEKPRIVCGVAILPNYNESTKLTKTEGKAIIRFDTNWRPPIDWVNHLAIDYRDANFTLEFCDTTGGTWCGEFSDRHKKYFEGLENAYKESGEVSKEPATTPERGQREPFQKKE